MLKQVTEEIYNTDNVYIHAYKTVSLFNLKQIQVLMKIMVQLISSSS